MKLHKDIFASAYSPKESGRDTLKSIHIDAENRCLVTTNGRILTRHPIPGNGPVKPGHITPDFWTRCKFQLKKPKDAMEYDPSAGTLNGLEIPAADPQLPYPNYRAVIPDFTPVYRFSFNPHLLLALALSMGVEKGASLTLELPAGSGPLRVYHGTKDGVIMPCFQDGSDDKLATNGKPYGLLTTQPAKPSAAANVNVHAPATGPTEADMEALRQSLFAARARVKELEAAAAASTAIATPGAGQIPAPAQKGDLRTPRPAAVSATTPPTLTRNTEKKGIELRFEGKPANPVRLAMKEMGFRWCPRIPGQPWVALYTEERIVFATALAGGQEAITPPGTPQAPAETVPQPSPAPTAADPAPPLTAASIALISPQLASLLDSAFD